ncbi:hypothetical protein BHE90_015996 [Fusarium euwallaceae]|uniref:Uncharacterized protein n=1 Tax=Fusarium euwallaceae TaxID=1147111 RepID=A0A430L1L0_9HYPO|nr:hypothetical protein BHE90_015996 [Fusarium euwallaceae]
MTSPVTGESTSSPLDLSELMAMSDDQLIQFMTQHRDSTGTYHLPVDGLEKMSEDERERLESSLEATERAVSLNMETSPQPLDLDDLDERLRQVPPNGDPTASQPQPQSLEQPKHPSPATNRRNYSKEIEILYYNLLIKDDGRPLYPIELIDEVFETPEKHRELIQPLQMEPEASQPFDLFREQGGMWRDFRRWQKDNRGLEDENDIYEAYVEESRFWGQLKPESAQAEFEEKLKKNPFFLQREWGYQQEERNRQRLRCQERGCNGAADYFEAVKRRLASHGFTRPFELKEDPTQQDQLTTWIEYLGYEYWCLDGHAEDMERLAAKDDEALKKLVDAKIVGPHDTIEDVRSMKESLQRDNDAYQSHTELRMAKAEAQRASDLFQESAERFQLPEKQRADMLNKVAQDVEHAERRHERVKARHDAVSAFFNGTLEYTLANMKWTRHRLYVQWVLEQLPLVETEMAEAEEEKSRASGKKRMLSPQESNAGPSQKRQKLDKGSPSPTIGNSSILVATTTQAQEKSKSSRPIKATGKRSLRSTVATSLPPGGLRRSARIAAYQPLAQPEPRQLRPRPTKKATGKAEASAGAKGTKGGRVGKKGSGAQTRSKKSRR